MVLINPVTYRRSLDVVATTVIEDFGLDRNDQTQFDNAVNGHPPQVDDGQNGLITANRADSTIGNAAINTRECEVGQYLQNGQCLSCQEISIAQAGFCTDNTVLSCTSPTQLVRCRECIQGYLPNDFNFCELTISTTATSTTATATTATISRPATSTTATISRPATSTTATTTITTTTTTTTPPALCTFSNIRRDNMCTNALPIQFVTNINNCISLCNNALNGFGGCCQIADYANGTTFCSYSFGSLMTVLSPAGLGRFGINCN